MTSASEKKALELISQGAHINPKDFSPYIPLSMYKLDSLDVLSTIQAIEIEFDIQIPDGVVASFKTGQDILNYLKDKID